MFVAKRRKQRKKRKPRNCTPNCTQPRRYLCNHLYAYIYRKKERSKKKEKKKKHTRTPRERILDLTVRFYRSTQRPACCNSSATISYDCCWCATCSATWCWICTGRSGVDSRGPVVIHRCRTRRSSSIPPFIIWCSTWPPASTAVTTFRKATSSPDPGIFPARPRTSPRPCCRRTATTTITITVTTIATIKSLRWDLIKPRVNENQKNEKEEERFYPKKKKKKKERNKTRRERKWTRIERRNSRQEKKKVRTCV